MDLNIFFGRIQFNSKQRLNIVDCSWKTGHPTVVGVRSAPTGEFSLFLPSVAFVPAAKATSHMGHWTDTGGAGAGGQQTAMGESSCPLTAEKDLLPLRPSGERSHGA